MPWYANLLFALLPIVGFAVGYILGRDHQGRVHAQRRREVNTR